MRRYDWIATKSYSGYNDTIWYGGGSYMVKLSFCWIWNETINELVLWAVLKSIWIKSRPPIFPICVAQRRMTARFFWSELLESEKGFSNRHQQEMKAWKMMLVRKSYSWKEAWKNINFDHNEYLSPKLVLVKLRTHQLDTPTSRKWSSLVGICGTWGETLVQAVDTLPIDSYPSTSRK